MQLIHFARARRPFGNLEALAALAWYLQYLTVRVAPVVFRSDLAGKRPDLRPVPALSAMELNAN